MALRSALHILQLQSTAAPKWPNQDTLFTLPSVGVTANHGHGPAPTQARHAHTHATAVSAQPPGPAPWRPRVHGPVNIRYTLRYGAWYLVGTVGDARSRCRGVVALAGGGRSTPANAREVSGRKVSIDGDISTEILRLYTLFIAVSLRPLWYFIYVLTLHAPSTCRAASAATR